MDRRGFLALGALALVGCEPVSLARRLLMAGGGASFATPPPATVTLTSAAQGGAINPWNIAGAYQDGGTAVVGYVDTAGNVEAITYDGSSVGGPYTVHSGFEADAHTGPIFVPIDSSNLAIFYCKHNATPLNMKTVDPADPSGWDAVSPVNLHTALGGTRYTDPQAYRLSDGTLFLFYRDEPSAGTDSRWCYSIGTWGGSSWSWSSQTQLFKIGSTRSYVVSWKAPGSDLIHFVATNGASSGFTKLGHFRMDGLTLARTKSDGTTIAASLPLTFTDITEAYSGTGPVFAANLTLDDDGYPVVCGADDLDVIYRRWTGSAWTGSVVASAGTGYSYNNDAGFGAWGHCVDDGDPTIVWMLRDTGGYPELWRYRTTDGGTSFGGLQVTSGATTEQQQVVCVRNPAAWLRAFWQVGTWTDYTDYAVGLDGVGS